MYEAGTDETGASLDMSHNLVRRRLLQSALQRRPEERAIRLSRPAVHFREPQNSVGARNSGQDFGGNDSGADHQSLVRIIELLRDELDARRREIQELHMLLRQAIDSNARRPWWAQGVTPYWSLEEPQQ